MKVWAKKRAIFPKTPITSPVKSTRPNSIFPSFGKVGWFSYPMWQENRGGESAWQRLFEVNGFP
jgi:hypothetical protein